MEALAPSLPTLRDRFRGCLLGGAVGDALGAPVEFMRLEEIRQRFGPEGIRDYAPAYGKLGAITDDTQMTLFTVEGIVRSHRDGDDRVVAMRSSYERWLATQGERPPSGAELWPGSEGWLYGVPELHSRRAPGNTCLSALRAPMPEGGVARNDSKGCGGVMRVAPVGLVAEDPYEYGCASAAITHGHPLGYESAGALAVLVRKALNAQTVAEAVEETIAELHRKTEAAIWVAKAAQLALSDRPADECVTELGEGWVAEEALAIGVFCALRGPSLEEAVVLGVNHSGDSDSTGSIAGQILGAHLGVGVIPARWLALLELRNTVERCANDLYDRVQAGASRTFREQGERSPG